MNGKRLLMKLLDAEERAFRENLQRGITAYLDWAEMNPVTNPLQVPEGPKILDEWRTGDWS